MFYQHLDSKKLVKLSTKHFVKHQRVRTLKEFEAQDSGEEPGNVGGTSGKALNQGPVTSLGLCAMKSDTAILKTNVDTVNWPAARRCEG